MTKTTTRYGEDWTLEQLQQNGDVLKEYYCRDIIREVYLLFILILRSN